MSQPFLRRGIRGYGFFGLFFHNPSATPPILRRDPEQIRNLGIIYAGRTQEETKRQPESVSFWTDTACRCLLLPADLAAIVSSVGIPYLAGYPRSRQVWQDRR